MLTAAPENRGNERRRGGTPLAANARQSNRKKSCNSLKTNDRRKFGLLQMDRFAATGWQVGFDSPVSRLLAASGPILPPSDSNRNTTSFKNVRNPVSPNEKAFSNRNTTSLFTNPQPRSVKLAPLATARIMTAARGRPGRRDPRGNARIFVGRSFSYGVGAAKSERVQPLKYGFRGCHWDPSAPEAAIRRCRTFSGAPRPCAPRLGRDLYARCKP